MLIIYTPDQEISKLKNFRIILYKSLKMYAETSVIPK